MCPNSALSKSAPATTDPPLNFILICEGVRSQIRTGLRLEIGILRELTGQIRKFRPMLLAAKRSSPVLTGFFKQISRAISMGISGAATGKIRCRYANDTRKIAIATAQHFLTILVLTKRFRSL